MNRRTDLFRVPARALALAVSATLIAAQAATPAPEAIGRTAAAALRPAASVMLGAAQAGARLVAVGERGIVLLSDDGARTWRQAAASPTSVTLTSVRFASPTRGWATGHAGLILATDDAGEHWRPQLDGKAFAAASLVQARASATTAADKRLAARAVTDAERLVTEGADKPFFDLWFADEKHGFAVGAYNLFARTEDGGATWVPAPGLLPNPKGNHLHAIRGRGEQIYIAGEQGVLLRSTDGGRSFTALTSPYAGSFFTLELLPAGEIVVAGLRGNAFRSTDQGDHWQALDGLPGTATWIASALSADGTLWLGNQAGQVFASRDAGQRWIPVPAPPGPPPAPLTGLFGLSAGRVLTTTLRGLGQAVLPFSQ